MATQAHHASRHCDAFGNRIETFNVIPENWPPLKFASVVRIEISPVAACVTHQAVDVLDLRLSHLFRRHQAAACMTRGTTAADHIAAGILDQPDPVADRAGAKIIKRVQLAQLLTACIDDIRRRPTPLVMLRVKESLGLFLVTLQTGFGSFVMLKVLSVRVLLLRLSVCQTKNEAEQQKSEGDFVSHQALLRNA